jgi:MFS family permease
VGGAVHIVPQDQLGHRRFLTLGAGFAGLAGQFVMSYLSDAIGRRKSGMLCGWGAALSLAVAGCYYDAFFGTVSVFWLLVTVASFFGVGSAALIRPYTAEVWPASLRASGMGLAYAIGSLGGLLSPLGLELIIGAPSFSSPPATPDCRLCCPCRLVRARRPRVLVARRLSPTGTGSRKTLRWREMDSNFRFRAR